MAHLELSEGYCDWTRKMFDWGEKAVPSPFPLILLQYFLAFISNFAITQLPMARGNEKTAKNPSLFPFLSNFLLLFRILKTF